ncbi:methylated-DNA--[protein]-cysteine S-methyltransferase [Primorskyibacter sp. S187A]|uniref:methylated-DNA--[protein]-cysteine S-methyltransferase n=1 Tax=Primorskyibacter sp. S187A TaxID=3415130 RepID=UPI003C7D89C8
MLEHCLPSPMGPLTVVEDDKAIVQLAWRAGRQDSSTLLDSAVSQLRAYLEGHRTAFDLPLRITGSAAQQKACAAMAEIAFGDTKTYGALARQIGVSAQAMGQLCGGNPIPILIPCHRVLSATGLGGFSGGIGVEDKVWLLKHEGAAGLLI